MFLSENNENKTRRVLKKEWVFWRNFRSCQLYYQFCLKIARRELGAIKKRIKVMNSRDNVSI